MWWDSLHISLPFGWNCDITEWAPFVWNLGQSCTIETEFQWMNKPPKFLPLSALLPITWKNNLSSIDVATSQQFVFVYSLTIKIRETQDQCTHSWNLDLWIWKFYEFISSHEICACAHNTRESNMWWDIHLIYLGVGQKLDNES
jgi:hypothetical protein